MSHDAILILFSSDSHHKRYSLPSNTSKHTSSILAKTLKQNTLQWVKKTNLPYVVYDDSYQYAKNFEDNITSAIQFGYTLGYSSVILIGDDCPQIHTVRIESVLAHLALGHNVLGPDERGGIYLLGMRKEYFSEEYFKNLPWQSKKLFHILLTTLDNYNSQLYILPRKIDLNFLVDVKIFFCKATGYIEKILSSKLQAILEFRIYIPHLLYTIIRPHIISNKSLRSPPLF